MGLSQALSSALAGVNTTQQSLSVIAGNVANANTPGYVDESVNQVETAAAGQGGTSVDVSGINRNLNTLLQSQLWTETSGGSYADTTSQFYQQLQDVYGTPGTPSSFDAHLQQFHHSPAVAGDKSELVLPRRAAVVSAAQGVAQNLNSMTSSIQQLRTQAEAGDRRRRANGERHAAADRPDQPAAHGDRRLRQHHRGTEDQRDQDVTPAHPADECQRSAKLQQSDFAVHRYRPANGIRVASLAAVVQQCRDAVGDVTMERRSEPGRRRHHHTHLAGRHHHRSRRHQCDSSRARSAPICRCATLSCRKRRTSSTKWPIRCRRPCRTRQRPARRSRPVRSRATASTSAAFPRAIAFSSPTPTHRMSSKPSPSSRSAPAARCRRRHPVATAKLSASIYRPA